MPDNRVIRDEVYYAVFENNTEVLTSTDAAVQTDLATARDNGLGYAQFTTLEEVINSYMAAEVGEDLAVDNVPRHRVEFHAQRGLQELSYDILQSKGTLEYQLDSTLQIPVPQDAVKITQVSWVDELGFYHPVPRRRESGNPNAFLQDETTGDYIYQTGTSAADPIDGQRTEVTSETITRFAEQEPSNVDSSFQNYYAGSNANYELYGSYNAYTGRRYGSNPETTQINGTYFYNPEEGVLYVDSGLSDAYIVIEYVTDGLNNDFSKIKIDKLAEEALYDYITWKLLRRKKGVNQYDKSDARNEFFTSKRRAKHRITGYQAIDLINVMRIGTKWIKH